ncbi:MAG TPA: SRPBCC family protein [Candidatus Udaeobacter sp.]
MKMTQNELATNEEPRTTRTNFIDVNTDSQSIVVNAPAAEVYRCCLRFEDLPRFITSITKVDRIDDTRFSCTSIIKGEEVTSQVQIIMRVPDRRIAWQAVSDNFRVGAVCFDQLLGGTTKVTVKVRSIIEPVMLTGALRRYLRNFKRFIEQEATT